MAVEEYTSKYGTVYRCVGCCKDDWKNIRKSSYYRKQSGLVRLAPRDVDVTLQKPALDSLRAVEEKLSRQIYVTGSLRTCELQHDLYASDPKRYASPLVGVHCQGLAIDVHTGHLDEVLRSTLLHHGWNQSRPTDEPWHFSFRVTA